MLSPAKKGASYSKLEQDTNHWTSASCPEQLEHSSGKESKGESLRKLLSPLGAKLRSPAGYKRLSEAGASIIGNASFPADDEEETLPGQAVPVAADTAVSSSDTPQPSQVHRGSGSFLKKPRPPRLQELSESEHPEDELQGLDGCAQQVCVAGESFRSAQQTFELAQKFTALRSPIARSAQSLKLQLEVLTSTAMGGDTSKPTSTAHGKQGRVLLSLRHEDQLLSPLAMLKVATPKGSLPATPKSLAEAEVHLASLAPGSPAAAEALLAARSRLAAAAAAAKIVIAATTPKALGFREALQMQTLPARGTDD